MISGYILLFVTDLLYLKIAVLLLCSPVYDYVMQTICLEIVKCIFENCLFLDVYSQCLWYD